MQKLLVVLALFSTVLIGGVVYELHGLNRRLDAIGLVPSRIAAGLDKASDYFTNPKYDAERQADQKRLIDAMTRDIIASTPGAAPTPVVHQRAPQRPDRP